MTDESREISIFLTAIEKEDDGELAAYLDQACGDDQQLRVQVEALVATHRRGDSFLERPAPGLDQTVNVNQAALDAGLSATFSAEAAVVIGDAGHSVLKSLSERLPNVPRVVLRDADAGTEKVVRPNSPDVPFAAEDGRYQLHGEIARGGMGAVIKARDADLGRDLAIKVLLDSHKEKPEVLQRFVEEAQIGGQLQHPGIVPVYELGQFGDRRPFFSMKLVKGDTLASLLTKRTDPSDDLPMFLGIFEQVCQTMAYAHSKGVIHRDLKPANIMVGAFGEVQVMDWGLAKVLGMGGVEDEKKSLDKHRDVSVIQTRRSTGSDSQDEIGSQTQMGSVLGTPAYMPPEQALGEVDRLDERADVFGLGAILCEILTGKPPYVGTDGTRVFRQASRGKLDDCFARLDECGADQELIELVKQMLAAEPEERLRNAGVVADETTSYLAGVQQRLKQAELDRAEATTRAEDAIRRRKLYVAIAGLMLTLAAGAGIGAVRFWQQREAQAALATRNDVLAKDNAAKRQESEAARKQIAIEKKNVETQRDRAIELQKTLKRELYIADMLQIQQAYHEGASDRVEALLKKYVSLEAESDLRGWEWYYWWRASHLQEQQFQDPEPFVSLAVSPDRTWLAVRGWPNDVHILDARTLRQTTRFRAGSFRHHFGWTEFAVSSDGRLFACISNKTIKLFKTEDWSELPSLMHDRALQAIVFSPSGLLAAADSRGRVIFWDLKQRAKKGSPLETGYGLSCLVFSPDGNRMATGHLGAGNNKSPSLLVWDVTTRKLDKQLVDKVHDVTALAWQKKGELSLLAAGFADGNVRLWEGTAYAERDWLGAGGSVLSLAFSPNGERLAAGTARNNAVVVWDTDTARRISVMKGHFRPVSGVGFDRDNQTVWSSSQDGYLKSWDVSRSTPYRRVSANSPTSGGGIVFGADGQSLWLKQGASDLRRWNSRTGDPLSALNVDGPAKQIAFSNNGRFLAVFKLEGEAKNKLQVWRTDVADPIVLSETVLHEDAMAEAPDAIAISDDGFVVSWCRGRNLVVLDISTGEQTSSVLESAPARLALSPDGKQLVEHAGWSARLWNIASGTPENPVLLSGFPVSDVQFSPDGKYLAEALLNNLVQLHDAATGKVLHYFRGHAGGVKAIDFSADGALLASGGVDGTVRLWDVAYRSLLVTLSAHDQPISSVGFSPDGETIASISDDGDTRLWRGGTESNQLDIRFWDWQAKVYREKGLPLDPSEAFIAALSRALEADRENESLLQLRADSYATLERWDEGAADYLAILQIRVKAANWTSGPSWNTQRSRFLQELTRKEAQFDALRRKLPDAKDLWLARGRSLALQSQWSASLKAFGQYTKSVAGEAPIESEIWFEIACLHQILDDDQGYRQRLTEFRNQAGEKPDQFDAFVLARTAGLARQAPDLAQRAVRWGEHSLTKDPRGWKLHALGLALYRAGEYDAARKKLRESLASNWFEPPNQLALALIHHATGAESQAEKLVGEVRRWRDEQLRTAVDGTVNVPVIDWLAIHALLNEVEAIGGRRLSNENRP